MKGLTQSAYTKLAKIGLNIYSEKENILSFINGILRYFEWSLVVGLLIAVISIADLNTWLQNISIAVITFTLLTRVVYDSYALTNYMISKCTGKKNINFITIALYHSNWLYLFYIIVGSSVIHITLGLVFEVSFAIAEFELGVLGV